MEEVYFSDTFMSHISLFFTHLLLLLSHDVKGTLSDSPPATIPPPHVKHIPLLVGEIILSFCVSHRNL